jgi:hypothetical protein
VIVVVADMMTVVVELLVVVVLAVAEISQRVKFDLLDVATTYSG